MSLLFFIHTRYPHHIRRYAHGPTTVVTQTKGAALRLLNDSRFSNREAAFHGFVNRNDDVNYQGHAPYNR